MSDKPRSFMFGRHRILRQIEKLDPQKDHFRISYLAGFHEFPWESTRSLEFALFRTYAVASVGRLLNATGEFTQRTQKRYDDTDLMLSEILEHGYDSEWGERAISQMNAVHGRFRISNEDFLYVLSTFVYEPQRFIDRFGYRKLTPTEKQGRFIMWREIGKRMKIEGIPETDETFEQFNRDYEAKHFTFHEGARRVADSTLNLFLGWYLPRFLWKPFRPFMLAIMDDPLLEAFRYKKPGPLVRAIAIGGLKLRGFLLRFIPARRNPVLHTQRKNNRTYPGGYTIEGLGP